MRAATREPVQSGFGRLRSLPCVLSPTDRRSGYAPKLLLVGGGANAPHLSALSRQLQLVAALNIEGLNRGANFACSPNSEVGRSYAAARLSTQRAHQFRALKFPSNPTRAELEERNARARATPPLEPPLFPGGAREDWPPYPARTITVNDFQDGNHEEDTK